MQTLPGSPPNSEPERKEDQKRPKPTSQVCPQCVQVRGKQSWGQDKVGQFALDVKFKGVTKNTKTTLCYPDESYFKAVLSKIEINEKFMMNIKSKNFLNVISLKASS